MQQVNDDMEDLYRRAAENYPLDTTGADWSKVQKALHQAGLPTHGQKDRRRYLLLLLLIPLGLLADKYLVSNTKEKGIAHQVTQNTISPSQSNNSIDKTGTTENSEQLNGPQEKQTNISGMHQHESPDVAHYLQGTTSLKTQLNNTISHFEKNIGANNEDSKQPFQEIAGNSIDQNKITSSRYPVNELNGNLHAHEISFSLGYAHTQTGLLLSSNSPANKTSQRDKRFYAGLFGGFDATTIKYQKVPQASYDYGIMLGYDINKRWSIEAGLSSVKKYYYSSGEYFNTAKLPVYPNTEINHIEGDCRMWELPVSVKYNFKRLSKSSFFGTAGVTSYFMRQEDYNYTYYYPLTGATSKQYYKTYTESSTHIISNLQFSAGYTRSLGKVDVRLEPYVKVPLKGVGIGSAPLTSAGIHIGITKNLF